VEDILSKLTSEFKQAYGDSLVSLILYGSAASGDFHEKFSDLNVLCVLREVSVEMLGKAESSIAWFVKKGNPPPLFFSLDEIKSSHDVFPIEFLDMQANHRVLFGEDIFEGLEIERGNHRLELEHELRSKFIGLRQSYLRASHDAKAVSDLTLRSLSSMITLFRHALFLMGEMVPLQKREVIDRFCHRANLDKPLFLELLQFREEGRSIASAEALLFFERYFVQIGKLVQLVDQLPGSSSEGESKL